MQKIIPERFNIREGMNVSVRKTKIGRDEMISLGEGKIRMVANCRISIFIPFLEEGIGDADKIKLFWEDGRYYFCGTATAFYPNQAKYGLLTLERLDEIIFIEKRRHVRLSRNLNIDYKLIYPPETVTEFHSRRIRSGIVENLSCGGLELITDDRLGIGDLLELGFEIPSFTTFMVFTQARIVRISENRNNNMPYRVAVQFTNIDPHDRRLIAAFILEEISNQQEKDSL